MADRPSLPDHEHLLAMYEHMVDGVLVVDSAGVVVCANPAATWMLTGRSVTLEGAEFGFPVADRNAVVIDVFTDRRGVRVVEMRVAEVAWRGEPAQLLSLRDVTDQARLLTRLDHAANFDQVTGLPNRAQFEQRLDAAIREARANGGMVAVLFVDVDEFKAVNDRYGHAVGDAFLHAIGARLRGQFRQVDTVARLAGDEFTVVHAHLEGPHDAEIAAAKILDSMAAPFAIDSHEFALGVSIGIALFPRDAESREELVRKADVAMYAAKRSGKQTYRFFEARHLAGADVFRSS